MSALTFDLIVIGAGPGGYVAAIRGAQLGLSVACVEKEPALGGTCLRVGCIPSKALLESSEQYHHARTGLGAHGINVDPAAVQLDLAAMLARKDSIVSGLTGGIDGLFKKNKVTRVLGTARLNGKHPNGTSVVVTTADGEQALIGKHVILAVGTTPTQLPSLPIDGDRIGVSDHALAYDSVPEHLVVVGAGYIGLELGSVWRRLGSRVTVLEYLDRILPGMDSEIATEAQKVFTRQGMTFQLGARIKGCLVEDRGVMIDFENAETLKCDRVLVAVGRRPVTADIGLDTVEIKPGPRGHIRIDERFQTSAPGVYAIGDIVRGPALAHKAEEEGIACVEWIATGYGHVDYDSIPAVCYTHPEIASVGKTEDELRETSVPYKRGVFHYRANGRARALGEPDGRVKILAHSDTDRVLGVHIIGARAGDMIAEAAVAIAFGASAEDIARASHAHPTLAEVIKEAALAVDGRVIHS